MTFNNKLNKWNEKLIQLKQRDPKLIQKNQTKTNKNSKSPQIIDETP